MMLQLLLLIKHLYFSAGTNCMTSRSSSYDATALASYQAALAGQLYPPDTQCENIQGTGSYMHRVSRTNGPTHESCYLLQRRAADTIRIYHECEGRIEKSVPRIAVWHHEACRVMTNVDPEGRIFLYHPHTNNGLFFKYVSTYKWRKQNAEKVTHIKGRLLDQAVVLFNCAPYHNGNFS